MNKNIKAWIDAMLPDVSGEQAHHAHILVVSGIIFTVIGMVMLLTHLLLPILAGVLPAPWTDLLMDFLTALGGYVIVRLVQSGRIRTAGWIVESGLWIVATMQMYLWGDPTSDNAGVLALLIYVAMGMILVGRRSRWVILLFATVTFIGMVLLWAIGYLPMPPTRTDGSSVIFSIIIWIANSSIIVILINTTTALFRNQAIELRDHISDLSKLEHELRDSEERYRTLVENLGEGVGLVDSEERFTFANPAAERIFGVPPGDLVGRNLLEFVEPEEGSILRDQTTQRRFGRVSTYEIIFMRLNGERRNLMVTTTPYFDSEGQFAGAFGIFRDITDRVQVENTLANERSLLRTLVDNLPVAVYVKDVDCRLILSSAEDWRNLGVDSEAAVLGKTAYDLFPPETAAQFYADDQRVIQSGQPMLNRAEQVKTVDGVTHWLLTSKVPVLDSAGEVVGLVGISLDITGQIDTETALRENVERFQALTSAAYDAIITIDHEGNITFWNTAAENLLGYKAEEVIGTNLHNLIVPAQYHSLFKQGFAQFIYTGRGKAINNVTEMTALKRNGTEFPIELSLSAFKNLGQWHAVGIIRDISERKRVENALKAYSENLEAMVEERTQALREVNDQLLRKEKLAVLGQLAGSVAHDLRNPLSVIKNAIYLLNVILLEPETDIRQTLDALDGAVKTADDIIGSLLDFARTNASDMQEISINQVVQASLSQIPLPAAPVVNVILDLDETLPNISGDPIKLQRVFTNLILNAIQAMPEGGRLTLHSQADSASRVLVSISDTGVGIREADRHKLFQPLFTTKPKGVGLGLALVMELVENHNGTIEVESAVGVGTTFAVRLPAKASGL